jgi:hypothetical protein
LLNVTRMRILTAAPLLFLTACVGDLVELGPKGTGTGGVDMATGNGGGGDMAKATMPDFGALTFTANIEPDINGTNTTACLGQICGCGNTGCHNANNNPILGTSAATAATDYTNLMAATYSPDGTTAHAVPVINKAMPAMSPLLTQLGPGGGHGGGQKIGGPSDLTYQKWLAWISQGAPQ